jgi:hypothetical protein
LFCSYTRFELGDWSKIRFWDDLWCVELPLKVAFLALYDIARENNAFVADHLDYSSGSLKWDVSFTRAAHDCELVTMASFFTLLYSFCGRREGKGRERQALMDPLLKGKFDVRSFYRVFMCNDVHPVPWKSIWKTKAYVKVDFFAWSAALGKILTIDNLRKEHVIVIDKRCMCKRHRESLDPLLHCEAACDLWNTIFSYFGLSWGMPLRMIDLFACWWTYRRSQNAVVWKMVPFCLMCACGRNEIIKILRTTKDR